MRIGRRQENRRRQLTPFFFMSFPAWPMTLTADLLRLRSIQMAPEMDTMRT